MEVRRAGRDDLIGIGRVADAAHWEAYSGLLDPGTIFSLLRRDYSPGSVRRRLLSGQLLVASEGSRVMGFAQASVEGDRIRLEALATDPAYGGAAAAAALLGAVRGLGPGLPVVAEVLLGCLPVEAYLEAQGFAPGEVLPAEVFGEAAVERRWWLAPA